MSITLAVIIGIALPEMVRQVPVAERKSRKRQHRPLVGGTASTTQSGGSPAEKKEASYGKVNQGNLLVPKSLLSAFRACAEAQKARLVAKLKAEKSTQRLLLQIQRFRSRGSDPDQDKRMIAAALSSLLPLK